jgi:outer membrane murein-binding lipoprotein Lpp
MRFLAIRRHFVVGGLVLSTALFLAAGSTNTVRALTKGYASSDVQLLPGMVASLASDSGGSESRVERASTDNADKIVGIATTANDSLVTIASGTSQAYIENEGGVGAFVTDVNGAPKKGDLLTISPLKGILMKADESSIILAVAEEDFSADQAEKYDISGDGPKSALIQKIRVNLDRQGAGTRNVADVKSSLDNLGKLLTGREIGAFRVLIALVIFLLVMITEGALLYGTISSAINSVGRNPMASGIIRHELGRVLAVVSLVLIVGLGAIYGILWI